jgi:hypothetical protein
MLPSDCFQFMLCRHTECCRNCINCETSRVAWTACVLADRDLLTEMIGINISITVFSIYGSIVLLLDLDNFFSFLILYTVGRTPWMGEQPVVRSLPTHRTTQTQNKRTQTSMPWMGFQPTIPAFEGAKTVHALDRAATVISLSQFY